MLYIVGIGPGNKKYILPEAMDTLGKCHEILGFSRALQSIGETECKTRAVKSLSEIIEILDGNEQENMAVIASGDPCFYGITDYIKKNYKGEIKIIPGISSYQYMMAKLAISWQGSFLGSLHGREADFIETVKSFSKSIWLTDIKNTPEHLCRKLVEEKVNCRVTVGENLSYEDERIETGMPENFMNEKFSPLCIVLVERI